MAIVLVSSRIIWRWVASHSSQSSDIDKQQTFLNPFCKRVWSRFLCVGAVALANSFSANGMEFYWGQAPREFSSWESGPNGVLYLVGDIRPGEYDRFRSFMLSNLAHFNSSARLVVLSSNGGDLVEALRISKLLKEMYVRVHVLNEKCASSCFFLFLSGTFRFAKPGSLGMHRAYFDSHYFAGLSPSQAQKRQSELSTAVKSILDENGVPQYLIDRMNGTSSAEMYWVNADDLDRLGMRPAWYEELLIAKCGFDKPLEEKFSATPKSAPEYYSTLSAYSANAQRVANCEWHLTAPEIAKLRVRLRPDSPESKSLR